MALYRYQVVAVGMWRGKIKRWNTTFHTTRSSDTTSLLNRMRAVCYPNPGDVEGDCSGGIASISVYESTGGPPISETIYFDWQQPSTWIPYLGTAWDDIPEGTPLDASGESALVLESLRPGLSVSGKPVYLRKYIHAIPSRTATDYAAPDIPPATVTKLNNSFTSEHFYTPGGVQGGPPQANPWYLNHQRVRGRRRPAKQKEANAFATGVVVGAQPPASGFSGGGGF